MAIIRRSAPDLAGDCEVQVEVAVPIATWGETVSGVLRLRAGSSREISLARVSLVSCRSGGGDSHRQYVHTNQLRGVHWTNFVVRWRASLQLPFQLEVPCGVPFHQDVMVRGAVHLTTGEKAVVAVNVTVAPPHCYTAAAACLTEVSGYQPGNWRYVSGTECLLYLRARGYHPLGKTLILRISIVDERLTGEVTLSTPTERTRRWMGWSRTPPSFRFSCSLTNLQPLAAEFERGLRALENRFNTLPVPASSPDACLDVLPVPASEGELPTPGD